MSILKLYSDVKLVSGAKNALLIDIRRGHYYSIPNSFCELYYKFEGYSIENIKEFLDDTEFKNFLDFYNFLHEYEFINLHFEEGIFIEINENITFYKKISNAIIECNQELNIIPSIIDLIEIGCEDFQFRFYNETDIKFVEHIISSIYGLERISVEIILKYSKEYSNENYIDFYNKYPIIGRFILHTSDENIIIYKKINSVDLIYKTKDVINSKMHCGFIYPDIFNVSLEQYIENLSKNSCLNNKISIDSIGNVKNCPSLPEIFGNIKSENIKQIINNKKIDNIWSINKDLIQICKDCEFRYICSDCRAYTEDPEDIYSKPLKCGYNPYTCEWEEWSTHPMKQKAIDFYEMRELIK
jgi:SPASM domain peptide maturase of grasp-with-spasm system